MPPPRALSAVPDSATPEQIALALEDFLAANPVAVLLEDAFAADFNLAD